jgi:hypothetical protein
MRTGGGLFSILKPSAYVEHEWSHTDEWRVAGSNNGTAEFDINGFLADGEAPAQAELLRIIESLFEKGGGENG